MGWALHSSQGLGQGGYPCVSLSPFASKRAACNACVQVNTQSLRRQRTHNRAHPPSASKRASTTALAS